MQISIVIACRNGERTLSETLVSLCRQDYNLPFEILFVDNGSTDGSARVFLEHAEMSPKPVMRMIDASERAGKSYALNAGIRAAAGRAILIFDADDTAEAGWLQAMATSLDVHPLVAARTNLATLNHGWIKEYRSQLDELLLSRLDFSPHCHVAGGGTLGVRIDVYEQVGEFDPTCTALEDYDWCIRAALKGFEIQQVQDAIVNYRFRDETAAIFRQSYGYARAHALLRKRYAQPYASARQAWLRLAATSVRCSLGYAKRRALASWKGQDTRLMQARYAKFLGGIAGDAIGAWTYGVPPRR